MLADFNDIDLHLADAEKVFTHLSEAKAMEAWNPDGKPLTGMQKAYLAFFGALLDYYRELQEFLKSQDAGYKGMIYRYVAENAETIFGNMSRKRYIMAGFNALTESEIAVFDHLYENCHTDFLWDIDGYYFSPEGKMEAGRFIPKLIKRWEKGEPRWIEDNLLSGDIKNITVVSVSKRIGQVKFAAVY